MKQGEVHQVVRAFVDPDLIEEGLYDPADLKKVRFIALVAVPGDTTYEVELTALKTKLDWKHINQERAQLLNRTLPIEIEFYRGQYRTSQIAEGSAQKWAEQITSLLEKESSIEPSSKEDVVMAPSAIAFAAIDKLNEKITDEVFKIIESDPEIKKEYDLTVSKLTPKEVNRFIGMTVKAAYHLEKAEGRQNSPSSTLISSHQKLKRTTT